MSGDMGEVEKPPALFSSRERLAFGRKFPVLRVNLIGDLLLLEEEGVVVRVLLRPALRCEGMKDAGGAMLRETFQVR